MSITPPTPAQESASPEPAPVQPNPVKGGKGLAITALILGIVAFATAFIPIWSWVALAMGIAAIVLGIFALLKHAGKGQAITGIAFGAVGLILSIIASIMWAAIFSAAGTAVHNGQGGVSTGSGTSHSSTSPSAAAKAPVAKTAKFGQTYTWNDGLSITVSAPQPYTPSTYAAGTVSGEQNIVFTYTIKNGTKDTFDPTLAEANLNSGGVAASGITDIGGANGNVTGAAPQGKLLPGQSVSWKDAWAVKDPNDLTLTFTLNDFLHTDAIFTK